MVHLGRDELGPLVLTIIIATFLLVPPASANYSIRIEDGEVGVSISAGLEQGVPAPSVDVVELFGNIPLFTIHLVGENASIIANRLDNALGAKSPSATASQVMFSAVSNGTSMHYDLSFRVRGVFVQEKGQEKVDLAWRAFVLPGEFEVNGFSINKLVASYLGEEIDLLAQKGLGGTLQEFRWFLSHQPLHPSRVTSEVAKLVLFNFTSLSSPLEDWTVTRNLDAPSIQLSSSTGFNLTFIERINDPTDPFAGARNLIYSLGVSIDAPWQAQASGDELHLGSGFLSEQIMSSLIIVSGAVLVGTVILEKRIQRAGSARGTRKGKR